MNWQQDDALSLGFSAGNYAAAYVSEDLETAWESEDNDPATDSVENYDTEYRAGFVIGFFGSCEQDEIDPDHLDEHNNAIGTYGPRMREIGIAVGCDACRALIGHDSDCPDQA